MNFKLLITLLTLSLSIYTGQIEEEEITYGPEFCVSGTFYNPVVEQCNSDPLVTADCSRIDLNNFPDNWIAVSRDLLKSGDFKYGDLVVIEHDDESICGVYEIHDTMSSRFNMKIDFLVPPGQKLGDGRWSKIKMKKILKES